MINIFLRADEIEMVMTDLERANQVRRLIRFTFLLKSYPKLAVTATERDKNLLFICLFSIEMALVGVSCR